MLQTFPIALVQIKAGNTSENLLNEIRQIIYSLHQSKEIPKKVYGNIIIAKMKEGITQKWILYLWILKIVKHLIVKKTITQSYRQNKVKKKQQMYCPIKS